MPPEPLPEKPMAQEESNPSRTLGIIVNPASGRDARRLFARAGSSTNDSKRNQVERLIVGAAAAGAERVVLTRDAFRIAQGACDALGVDIEIEMHDLGYSGKASDTRAAVELMRERECAALGVLGGDGTSRIVASTWPDAPILPLSTGTNNVFPQMLEATVAGAALGLVASGRVPLSRVARRTKIVRVEIEGESDDLALIDAVHMVDDSTGNLLPFDPEKMRTLVLSRALPDAVGVSPIGGLLEVCSADDEFALLVECAAPGKGGRTLLAPISPGLYRPVEIASHRRLPLGERVEIRGGGLIACDGDRERALSPNQRAHLRVERNGPFLIEAARTLAAAAESGLYLDREPWHDHREGHGPDCC